MIVTDRSGRIEYVNPAFETASGYARAEVLGRNPSILKSGVHTPEFYGSLEEPGRGTGLPRDVRQPWS